MSTWVDRQGLYARFGEEFIQKLARRRDFDCDANDGDGGYTENETKKRVECVIDLAISDAKEWMLWKISCNFPINEFNALLNQDKDFSFLKSHHIKLTIAMLKTGGDCTECEACQKEIGDILCDQICTDDGICIPSRKRSKFLVEKTSPSCLPTNLCCGCGSEGCCCGT
jgi:hypothetical protein